MEIKTKSYGVDVASYNSSSVNFSTAKFAIVKVSEGTNYRNPKASAQIKSAISNGMMAMAYHFATFGSSSSAATTEAKYAVSSAKASGLPSGSYIACDWETGDGNNVNGGKSASATAIVAFMKAVKDSGYKPLLYSGAYLLKNNVDTSSVTKRFGDCLWVAAYPLGNGVASSKANFGYFPSMNGVAIWQFTDNWNGLHVDGNINVLPLKTTEASSKPTAKAESKTLGMHPVVKWDIARVAVVANASGAYIYTSPALDKRESDKLKPMGSVWKVLGEENGAIKVGHNQYFDGRAVYTKSNPIATNSHKHAVAKIVESGTHALYEPKADSSKAYAFKTNQEVEIIGRVDRFLQLKDTYKGKTVYVTGNRAYIRL
ncbi:GH25 family lysozyme [Lactobacillus xujianguonis]|uniref:GH25 family lysozyme n=1 Tax=Lactobacillus xujianguonis TaxID=2495899 RepID=UPI000FD7C1FC|nr:GH25 family lysozyme [Lactobacillus xujianguonis]RVU73776.1 lysin [Lactobacillus xujianguonis]